MPNNINDSIITLKLPKSIRGEKGIVADTGIVANNDISRTIIVIKK